jgi:hypothetical protein
VRRVLEPDQLLGRRLESDIGGRFQNSSSNQGHSMIPEFK